MTHPLLSDPENLRAFQHLTAVPIGTVRTWAEALGWKKSRMERFLLNLARYGLGQVDARSRGSTFLPTVSDTSKTRLGPNQEDSGLTTQPRLQRNVEKCQSPAGERLIAIMNSGLQHFDSYLPVRSDNYGSHRAAERWIVQVGIRPDQAAQILWRLVNSFSLEKSGGDYPRSLGYFTKAVLAEWRRIQRGRDQLPLIPDLKLEVA